MSGCQHQADVDLVAAILTHDAADARPADASEYSWGAVARLMPARVHARASAVAVLDGLRGAGRLVTANRLAEFGRHGWAFGWIVGAVVAGSGERHEWPWWLAFGVGAGSFAAGVWAIGWVARQTVGRGGGSRG